MKAAEAAFKNSVDVWEGSTRTERGLRHLGPHGSPITDRPAFASDIAATQQCNQVRHWNTVDPNIAPNL